MAELTAQEKKRKEILDNMAEKDRNTPKPARGPAFIITRNDGLTYDKKKFRDYTPNRRSPPGGYMNRDGLV